MAPKWLRTDAQEAEGGGEHSAKSDLGSIEIKPEVIANAVKPQLDAFKTEISGALDEKLKAVNDFFAEQTRQREAAARQARQQEDTPEEVDYYTNPDGAIDKKLQPLIRSQQAANAMLMINETIGDMDYYKSDPEFKAKVLAKINSQPLAVRANPDIIMNCYKLVAYDESAAIKEGKYKSMLGAASTGGTGSHSGRSTTKEDEVSISDEEKVYARKMGIKEEDWVKSKRTLEYI
jgi:hypothetical protein